VGIQSLQLDVRGASIGRGTVACECSCTNMRYKIPHGYVITPRTGPGAVGERVTYMHYGKKNNTKVRYSIPYSFFRFPTKWRKVVRKTVPKVVQDYRSLILSS